MDLMLPIPTIPSNSSTQVSCCSGKVISLLNLFMYLGEFFEAILEEHDINPMNYDRILSNVDAHIWHGAMETKLESTHFNKVWELVEALEGIKPIGWKWDYKRNKRVARELEMYIVGLVKKGYN